MRDNHLVIARPAVIMSDTGTTLSHAELERRSTQFANLLRGLGLADGDRVAILMENRIEWIIAMWGVRRANLFYVPVNWHLAPAEIRYVIKNSEARVIVTSARLADMAREACEDLAQVILRLSVGGGAGFEDWGTALDHQSDAPPAVEHDGNAMPYSSGTTGMPKGILRPLTGDPFATPNSLETLLCSLYTMDADTVYLSPAPIYHSSPIGFTNAVLVAGGTVVMMPAFDADAALAAIERYKITHAQFVPTHFVRMLRLDPEARTRHDLSSLRVIVHAAAPCAPDVKRAMIEWLGPIIFEYYAGSERCGFTAIDSAQWLAHPGSVGPSLTGAIHILDLDSGEELPTGEIGEIYFENPVPFTYHGDSAKTAATFSRQGWGSHGDVGHVDADGFLYLSDRRSDLILSGGVNIYPQEVENVLALHPGVADCAVIGIPDPEYGQRVKAVVQRAPGSAPSADDLITHCRLHLGGFKIPREIDFTDMLPRLPNGKLLRRRLASHDQSNPKEPV